MALRIHLLKFLLLLLAVAGLPFVTRAEDDDMPPHPSYPAWAKAKGEFGTAKLDVVFDSDGTVKTCAIKSSTGHADLDNYSINFIRKNWHSKKWAGTEVILPLVYDLNSPDAELPTGRVVRDLVPRSVEWSEHKSELVIRCTCGPGGRIVEASILESSGSEAIDRAGLAWLRKRAFDPADVGRVVDVPLRCDHFTPTNRF